MEMACKHCGEMGHVIRECPKKLAEDKVAKRKRQYEKKKMIRAAERLAIKNRVNPSSHSGHLGTHVAGGAAAASGKPGTAQGI